MEFGEHVAKKQRGGVDRISELPEFILHTILSMLDNKEAGRASVLSKRWYDAWSSIPVLEFHPQYFQKYGYHRFKYDDYAVERFVEFIDKIMERYFTRKCRITKMNLTLPKVDEKIEILVDKWIMIAVQNQIQRLEIQINGRKSKYRLPEILFCAKSLKYLKCGGVILPFYETMKLTSLEYLALHPKTLDEDMLQKIISFCPLVELDIAHDMVFAPIWLPWMKQVNGGVKSRCTGTMQSNLQESPLQKFVYSGIGVELLWPWNMNFAALKNLRKLEFRCVHITDDIVSELLDGLVVLESLIISSCSMLKCINISSNSLKQLRITDSLGLEKATIDAPKLLEFLCNCELVTTLMAIRSLDHCNAQFFSLDLCSVTNVWLVKLKKFLVQTNFFKSVVIKLDTPLEILVEEDQLRNIGNGSPYKLRELKLRGTTPTNSSLMAFLNGLFWCCHPDVLSMTTNLEDSAAKAKLKENRQGVTVKGGKGVCVSIVRNFNALMRHPWEMLLRELQEKAECWKDPLKSIEVESIEYPRLLSYSTELEIRLKLSW